MKYLFFACIFLLLSAFSCNEKKSDVKEIKQQEKRDSVPTKTLKPIVITDSTITYFRDKENSFQEHTYFVHNYKIVFNNLLLNSSDPAGLSNSVEVWQNDKCLYVNYSDYVDYDDKSKEEFEKSKLDIIKKANKVSKTEKAYEIEAKGHFQGSFFLEQIGNIYKNGITYVIIKSNHNGGNAGGSDLLVFELGDTLRKVLDIFAHYGDEGSEYDIKDIDGDSIPEVIFQQTFQYTSEDCASLELGFINLILKFKDGEYVLYKDKMQKPAPTDKQMKKYLNDIADIGGGDYQGKRQLFYTMLDLSYHGNKESAYKLLELAGKKFKIKVKEFKKDFDKKLKESEFWMEK